MIALVGVLAAALRGAPARPATIASDSFPRLVTAAWVAAERQRTEVVLIHVDRTRAGYDSAHVAGAGFVTPSEFTVTRAGILTELPPTADLVSLVERLGISNRSEVVLYGDFLATARLFMTLDYLGHDRVAILDGGLDAWREAGLAVAAGSPPVTTAGRFQPAVRPGTIATTEWVQAHLADTTVRLLDARSPNEYSGDQPEEGVSRPGHLPGAVLLDWHTLVEGSRFKPADQLRALVRRAGAQAGRTAVAYCRVGTRASLLYFVLRYLGQPVRLYDGSLNEWSANPALPVVLGPSASEPAGASTEALWETVVVKREATTSQAEYRSYLAGGWSQARERGRAAGLILEYRILTGRAEPDDLMPWDVVLVTVFRNEATRQQFEAEDAATAGVSVEGPAGHRLARQQYVTVLREP